MSFETAESARGVDHDWAFGDGTATVHGPRATHAFARSGRYVVRAAQSGQLVATFNVTILPRPVLNAIPPEARAAVFVPRARDLVVAVEFLNRAIGSIVSNELTNRQPLLGYGLSIQKGRSLSDLGLDEEEGLALFQLAEGEWIATTGITDASKALAAAGRVFEARGFRGRPSGEGTIILQRERDRIIGLVDRGYLYLAKASRKDAAAQLMALRGRISAIPAEGISRDPLLAELRAQVPEGQASAFWRENEVGALGGVRSGFAAMRFEGDAMNVDGRLRADRPLWDPTRSPKGLPLEHGAEGPVIALSASVAPEELARLLRGPRVSAREIAEVARVLVGDVAVAAYFDAGATARAMRGGPRPSAVSGTVIAHAGIRDRTAAERLVEGALERNRIQFEKRSDDDATVFLLEWSGRPTTIEVAPQRISLEAGEPIGGRQGVALAESLRARFVPTSFGTGHVSFVLDVGQVAKGLDPGPFGRPRATPAILGLLSVFLRQATAVETIFMDVAPDENGGRLRGRVTLRPR